MAEANGEQNKSETSCERGGEEKKLRYLGLLHVAAIRGFVWASSVYELGKERSGLLKGGVERAEGTVKGLVGPFYEKFRDVPLEFLMLVDGKVGYSLSKLERHVPVIVWETYALAQKAISAVRTLARDVQRSGVVETTTAMAKDAAVKYEPKARELYGRYELVAERHAVTAWRRLNTLPLFPYVVQIAVPTAAYLAEKYNVVVAYGREKGYAVAGFVPVVPVERIVNVFGPRGSGEEVAE